MGYLCTGKALGMLSQQSLHHMHLPVKGNQIVAGLQCYSQGQNHRQPAFFFLATRAFQEARLSHLPFTTSSSAPTFLSATHLSSLLSTTQFLRVAVGISWACSKPAKYSSEKQCDCEGIAEGNINFSQVETDSIRPPLA